jgi:hypothetical protein
LKISGIFNFLRTTFVTQVIKHIYSRIENVKHSKINFTLSFIGLRMLNLFVPLMKELNREYLRVSVMWEEPFFPTMQDVTGGWRK